MKYVEIENEKIPALGLGTYGLRGSVAVDIVCHALQLGYRHIDTAQWYENEQTVGAGVRASGLGRREIFLATKVRRSNLGKKDFLPSVEESLRKLQTDCVDLLLIHWPHATLPLESYLEELMKAREQGKTRFVGVSNFNTAQLKAAMEMGVPVFTNQVEFHPLLDQSILYDWMKRKKLPLTAYCPLAQGKVASHPLLKTVGEKYSKSAAQISLRWLLQKERAMAIPKTASRIRLRENLDVFDFELQTEDMKAIDKLKNYNGRIIPGYHGADWDDRAVSKIQTRDI